MEKYHVKFKNGSNCVGEPVNSARQGSLEKYSVNTRTRQNTGRRTRGERLDKAARRHSESSGTTVDDKNSEANSVKK